MARVKHSIHAARQARRCLRLVNRLRSANDPHGQQLYASLFPEQKGTCTSLGYPEHRVFQFTGCPHAAATLTKAHHLYAHYATRLVATMASEHSSPVPWNEPQLQPSCQTLLQELRLTMGRYRRLERRCACTLLVDPLGVVPAHTAAACTCPATATSGRVPAYKLDNLRYVALAVASRTLRLGNAA